MNTSARRCRLLVLGDLMLDRYTWGGAERVSPEAPVLVLRTEEEEVRLGGAASVAALLAGLDACGVVAGVTGDDPAGRIVQRLLSERGQNQHSLLFTDATRPTTVKQRLLGRAANRLPHQILRLDSESREPLGKTLSEQLAAAIVSELPNCQAVLVSDYAKGVCTPSLLDTVIDAARALRLPVLIDPAVGVDYNRYRGATVIKPNRREAELASGRTIRSPEEALVAGRELCERWDLAAAVITLDADGLVLVTSEGDGRHWSVPPREVCDVTGAGDTVLAVLGTSLAKGRSLRDACRLANVAAALQVERLGVATISPAEIARAAAPADRVAATAPPESPKFWHTPPREHGSAATRKILALDALVPLVEAHRAAGRRIVFTNGCFDLLHVGHLCCLEEAAALGDLLIVAVNSDASVRRLKGNDRPLIGQLDRATLVAALAAVNYVVIFNGSTPHALLKRLRPHLLVKGGTYRHDEIVAREVVESYGGEARLVRLVPGISTTALVERLRASSDETLRDADGNTLSRAKSERRSRKK
jgi:D-beta-D-heptose 7-phosphate kinase/D-beta-D-heptose 1-phosphate adenosyltransferase